MTPNEVLAASLRGEPIEITTRTIWWRVLLLVPVIALVAAGEAVRRLAMLLNSAESAEGNR